MEEIPLRKTEVRKVLERLEKAHREHLLKDAKTFDPEVEYGILTLTEEEHRKIENLLKRYEKEAERREEVFHQIKPVLLLFLRERVGEYRPKEPL